MSNYVDIRAIIWTLLETSLLQGCPPLPDPILSEYLTSPHLCPDVIREFLAPYAIYYSYRAQLAEGNLPDAAAYLTSLIQFSYLPSKYALALMAELLPILDRTQPRVLPASEITSVMTLFYRLQKSQEIKESLDFLQDVLDEAKRIVVKEGAALDDFDWRAPFIDEQRPASAKEVSRLVRESLVREISRAYLDEE